MAVERTTAILDEQKLCEFLAKKRFPEALTYLESVRIALDAAVSRKELANVYFSLAQCLYRMGEYRKAAIKLKCSIKLADSLNDNLLYARQKYSLAQIYRQMGRVDDALNEYTESHAFFKRLGDKSRMLAAIEAIAVTHFEKGDLLRAMSLCEDVLVKAQMYRIPESRRMTSLNLCRILLWTGNLARVRELLNSVADDCNDPLNQTWLESLWGTYYVRMLDHDRARKHLATAVTIARKNGYRRDEVVCMEYLGLNEFYEGNYSQARTHYEEILSLPEITASAVAQTKRLLTDVLVVLGELDEAGRVAAEAETSIRNIKEWVELGCLHRARALLADRQGDPEGTTLHFDKALEMLTYYGARYEVAATALAMGHSCTLDQNLRRARLQESQTLFAEMGVQKRVTEADKALARLSPVALRSKFTQVHEGSARMADIITEDPEMLRILGEADRLADTDETILITGETGVGKDLLAKGIHCSGRRSSKRFLPISCPNLSETLLESRLFGHRKGAFSGAIRDEEGLFVAAEGGAVLLNEIGEVPEIIQSKLLEVIETKTMFRLGDSREYKVDVRLFAATNRDLQAQVSSGSFRRDLFYRLQDFHLHLPPLRERMNDLPLLVRHFLRRLGSVDCDLRQATLIVEQCDFARYDWPGNIRELRGIVKRAVTLTPSHSVAEIAGRLKVAVSQLAEVDSDRTERAKLTAALARNSGCQTSTAKELGIPVSTLRNKLRKYRII